MTACHAKKRYGTETKALRALERIQKKRSRQPPQPHEIECRAYACPVCWGWHLTSQPLAHEEAA